MNAVIYPEPAPIAHAQTTSGARASTAHSAAIELEVTQDMVQVIIHFSSNTMIRGTENELMLLEQEWDKVQNQTLWTLEYCYIPSNNTQPENSAPSQTQVSQIQNSAELTTATVPSAPAGDDGVASTPEPTESTGEHAPTSQPTDSNVNHSSPFRSSQELLPTT